MSNGYTPGICPGEKPRKQKADTLPGNPFLMLAAPGDLAVAHEIRRNTEAMITANMIAYVQMCTAVDGPGINIQHELALINSRLWPLQTGDKA